MNGILILPQVFQTHPTWVLRSLGVDRLDFIGSCLRILKALEGGIKPTSPLRIGAIIVCWMELSASLAKFVENTGIQWISDVGWAPLNSSPGGVCLDTLLLVDYVDRQRYHVWWSRKLIHFDVDIFDNSHCSSPVFLIKWYADNNESQGAHFSLQILAVVLCSWWITQTWWN